MTKVVIVITSLGYFTQPWNNMTALIKSLLKVSVEQLIYADFIIFL